MKLGDKMVLARKEAYQTVDLIMGEKSKDSLEKFSKTCRSILESNDPHRAYVFAKVVSNYLDEDYKKLFNVEAFQNLVTSSDDEELIFSFGREVAGADMRKIRSNVKSEYAKKEIEKDMQVL